MDAISRNPDSKFSIALAAVRANRSEPPSLPQDRRDKAVESLDEVRLSTIERIEYVGVPAKCSVREPPIARPNREAVFKRRVHLLALLCRIARFSDGAASAIAGAAF